jgi:uncharacterized protein YgiM (DUF1202 family)
MHTARPAVPRWLIALAVGALMLSLLALPGLRIAQAQEATTTPTLQPTAAPTEAAAPTTAAAAPTETPAAATETPAATDTATSTATEETAAPTLAVGDTPVVADGPLNLRSAAGTSADVVTQLDSGATVTITAGPESADGFTWYQVDTADGDSGWVAGDFLGSATQPTFSAGDAVVVVDGPLNVRSEGSLNGTVDTQLATGDSATIQSGPVAADNFNWYEISFGTNSTGWVAGEFLGRARSSSGSFGVGDAVRINAQDINFRADAGLNADVLDQLDQNALFLVQDGPVSSDGMDWYQVFNFYYGQGWVAGDFLTLDPNGFPTEGL